MFTDTARNAIHRAALNLVTEAQRAGVVVTIETTPHQPLAMGNHDMSVTVRDARRPPPFAVSYGVRLGTELQGIVGTAMFQARRLVEGEGQSKSDLLDTLQVLDHAVRHGLVSLAAPEVVDCARELQALRKKVATFEARDALGWVPPASQQSLQLDADNYRWLRDQANEEEGPFIAMGTTHFKECGHTQLWGEEADTAIATARAK